MTLNAQKVIPLDTINWKVNAKDYIFETFKGQKSIYLKSGSIQLKNKEFSNGTIEFDIFLKKEQAFPGVFFRVDKDFRNGEEWYIRPHLPGKADANQATPLLNGISAWQLYFGKKYSFPYEYKYDDWTHVKLVVNDNKAQVFLDWAKKPNLSWNLLSNQKSGDVHFIGGNRSGMHIANIRVDENKSELIDFKPQNRKPIKGILESWKVSDKFEEKELNSVSSIKKIISNRKWNHTINTEEGVAANISRKIIRYDKERKKNTVLAKIEINSKKSQTKLFEFGYSDRVVVILNGKPIYRGNNRWRSRDYRYLGTIGLFDAVYLPLKKGNNTLLMAVSEDFGGWLVTGKFSDRKDVEIKQ